MPRSSPLGVPVVSEAYETPRSLSPSRAGRCHGYGDETGARRWGAGFLEGFDEADFARPLQHPEHGQVTIDWLLQLYSWHGRHHVAHVTELRKRETW